ncbi:threonine aldolase, low-specificity [Hyphomonas neptunium ATCC 15444]|uniref:Threonine aldolase, low-specificity n=2 Tax=Hyphomonas TaxID=85 RepID=Q0C4Y8_HYPNA|nr:MULTISPECIES: beta-eliminating lyase-related protein [Hyphomonas]ABI78006.1 threonine aldolase, low-specificity [Hyphomonas neptunium ATCC 15444]KCZ95638.1 threonine aldolase, low-specificity [Hyphomonas hirschiana VP5]
MNFSSDTAAPAHPSVLEAMGRANDGAEASYGADRITARLRARLAEVFETDDFDFWLTASGTASNALALSCFCPPTHSILCHHEAHIQMDERGAVEFFTGGGRLALLPGTGAKIDYDVFADYLGNVDPSFVHGTPPAVLSLTNLTECGMAYSPDEVARFARRAKGGKLAVHMDGARFANALVHTGASPAQMSWQAGVDVLTLGLTKTGAAGCEIILLFGAAKAKGGELRARAKRSGHMPPKMRFLAAQAEAMLEGGLWLTLAAHANAMAARLAGVFTGAGYELAWDVQGNEVFALLDPRAVQDLQEDNARFYADWPGGSSRFVCSWATTEAEIADLKDTLVRPPRI